MTTTSMTMPSASSDGATSRRHPATSRRRRSQRPASRSFEDLVAQAQRLADKLEGVPSRNQLKTVLRIGAPKATAVLAALNDGEPARSEPGSESEPAAGSVSAVGTQAAAEPETAPESELEPALESKPEPGPTTLESKTATVDSAASGPTPEPSPEPVSGSGSADSTPIRVRSWPLLLLAAPALVAIWSGWVGLGELTGFGVVHPLPGIWDRLAINTAITLPVGVETYAAYALRAWLSPHAPVGARRFAKWSAIGALMLGASGQVAYHLMVAAGIRHAPWPVTTAVACLPVTVLGAGAALAHLLRQPSKAEPPVPMKPPIRPRATASAGDGGDAKP